MMTSLSSTVQYVRSSVQHYDMYNTLLYSTAQYLYNAQLQYCTVQYPTLSGDVHAGSSINENHKYFLSHNQKLFDDGQKSFRHVRLGKTNRFVKGISPKIVRRCHTEKLSFSAKH